MSEHFTRSTVEASAWCGKCQKQTMHRIDDRRKGPCLECIARLDEKHDQNQARLKFASGPEAQRTLFGEAT